MFLVQACTVNAIHSRQSRSGQLKVCRGLGEESAVPSMLVLLQCFHQFVEEDFCQTLTMSHLLLRFIFLKYSETTQANGTVHSVFTLVNDEK